MLRRVRRGRQAALELRLTLAYVVGIYIVGYSPVPQSSPAPRRVRLFRNNRNQAIRIPVEFELPGSEAIISRDGDRLIIEPVRRKGLGRAPG